MDILTNVYLETIHPLTNYSRIISLDVGLSILIHTSVYIIIVYIVSCVFNIHLNNLVYVRLFALLILVMFLGYLGRLCRSKSLYNYYKNSEKNNEICIDKTLNIMHNGYFNFYFLG